MALWATVKAHGLKCHVVPVMSVRGRGTHFRGDFDEFQGWGGTDHERDDLEDTWGSRLPDSKVTWLGGKTWASKEVQMAYMAVGSSHAKDAAAYTRLTSSLSSVQQPGGTLGSLYSRRYAHQNSIVRRAQCQKHASGVFLGRYQCRSRTVRPLC